MFGRFCLLGTWPGDPFWGYQRLSNSNLRGIPSYISESKHDLRGSLTSCWYSPMHANEEGWSNEITWAGHIPEAVLYPAECVSTRVPYMGLEGQALWTWRTYNRYRTWKKCSPYLEGSSVVDQTSNPNLREVLTWGKHHTYLVESSVPSAHQYTTFLHHQTYPFTRLQ